MITTHSRAWELFILLMTIFLQQDPYSSTITISEEKQITRYLRITLFTLNTKTILQKTHFTRS